MEDDAALAHMLKALLAYAEFTSEVVPAGRLALPRDIARFSVVLVDRNLAHPEGHSLIREIRAKSQQPLIVISETMSGEHRTTALEAGADFAIEKPFLPGELLAIIRSALQRRASAAPPRD
jgi:two-component system KDP operon response regulator KdpE